MRLFLILVGIWAACFAFPHLSVADESIPDDDDLGLDLDQIGVANDEEFRLLRGNFYYSYISGDYYRTLYYLDKWQTLKGEYTETEAEAEVIRAATLLSLGLVNDAELVFYRIARKGASASGDSWFLLAQRLFMVGQYERAELSARNALIARPQLSRQNEHELRYILVSSIASQYRIKATFEYLDQMFDDNIWTTYARYNTLIAMIDTGYKSAEIEAMIENIEYFSPKTEEGRAVRDRALLNAGIYASELEKNSLASSYFQKISLTSPFSAPALLHYGWNLVAEQRLEKAIQPWRILQKLYDPYNPDVIESFLTIPRTLERFDAISESLVGYQNAETMLKSMVNETELLMDENEIRLWIDQWENENAMEDWGWGRQSLSDMPDAKLSQVAQALISSDEFYNNLERLHDLKKMKDQVSGVLQDLESWSNILVERQSYLQGLNGEEKIDAYQARQYEIIKQSLGIQQRLYDEDENIFAYATDAEKANIDNLQNVVGYINFLRKVATPTRDLVPYIERWRRVRGVQLWDIYMKQPQREWNTTKNNMVLRSEVDTLFVQLENTKTSLEWADSSWEGFPERVTELREKYQRLLGLISDTEEKQSRDLVYITRDYLGALSERFRVYLGQTQLSIARIYDDALQKQLSETEKEAK
ncbi:MAG: hypothetical protein P1U57_04655 [Oleibacter sp.]|nr:hypothetical protein [Thalassolituus sp.]